MGSDVRWIEHKRDTFEVYFKYFVTISSYSIIISHFPQHIKAVSSIVLAFSVESEEFALFQLGDKIDVLGTKNGHKKMTDVVISHRVAHFWPFVGKT